MMYVSTTQVVPKLKPHLQSSSKRVSPQRTRYSIVQVLKLKRYAHWVRVPSVVSIRGS